jgi:plasmid stabilization system protein ParE
MDSLSQFSAERFNPLQEQEYCDGLFQAFQMLLIFPNTGTDRNDAGQ